MKEIFFTTVLLFTLFSCSTDDQKEVLSYSEIGVSQAGKLKTEPKQTAQKDTFNINFNSALFTLISGLKIDSVSVLKESEVMDRVKNVNTEKVNIFVDSMAIQFKSWDFQDSSDLKTAWYNMLDCFGEHCESIELFDSLFQTDNYNLVFVAEKSIDWIASKSNLNNRDWRLYLKKERIRPKYLYVFEILNDERIVWYNFDEKGMNPKTDLND
ncbi:MAG: hypothetical protein ISP69_05995 [Crocinitomicaceae bacterium]|nr:hypothetical protein [Crocinitomicaceae bacterium]